MLPVLATLVLMGNVGSLVAAERQFSKTCGEIGFRDSFLEFFAEDGISFTPGPGNAREGLLKLPKPSEPDATVLQWEPIEAECSSSGDLGFTTGPLKMIDRKGLKLTRHGHYFSIWKHVKGEWKVLIDLGVGHPDPDKTPQARFIDLPKSAKTPASLPPDFRGKVEWADLTSDTLSWTHTRVHQVGVLPLIGVDAPSRFGKLWQNSVKGVEILDKGFSAAKDMAWSYGKLNRDASPVYFARIWRVHDGRWVIAVQVINGAPPKP